MLTFNLANLLGDHTAQYEFTERNTMVTHDEFFITSRISADDDFLGTIVDSPNFDVRKAWEKAFQEGKIKKSWFTLFLEGSRSRKVMHEVEHCLMTAGLGTTNTLLNELNLAQTELEALKMAKELKAIKKQITILKKELKPKKKKEVVSETHPC